MFVIPIVMNKAINERIKERK